MNLATSFAAAVSLALSATAADNVAQTSFYVQDGLIGHLDAIENGGAGVHEDAPETWTDLTGNHTFTCVNGSQFSSDAWVGNLSRYISSTSDKALAALKNKAFTLEMVVMHPASPLNKFEYWTYFGHPDNYNRHLTMEIRTDNSKNPVVGGLQYRAGVYNEDAGVLEGTGLTEYGKRQYLAVVCNGNTATIYANGKKVLHKITSNVKEPSLNTLTFGADGAGGAALNEGVELCAIRMSERVLSEDELVRNNFVDRVRFMGADATDEAAGCRIVDGTLQLRTRVAGKGVQFSADNGVSWQNDSIDIWSEAGESVTFSARIAEGDSSVVAFANLPSGATAADGVVTLTASAPVTISALAPDAPATTLYVQDGLVGHYDAIENAGYGSHETSPATWTDLTGNNMLAFVNGVEFSADAWKGNLNRYAKGISDKARDALKSKKFTLELVISHPATPINTWEHWAYFGDGKSKRHLIVDLRPGNSRNPLVQGLQYRGSSYHNDVAVPVGTQLSWSERHTVAAVCDGNTATLYADGTNFVHSVNYGSVDATLRTFAIGASPISDNPINVGGEICAVRMTSRVLSDAELLRNRFLDGARFMGENATDGTSGWRISQGKVQAKVKIVGEGIQYSDDGGATWNDGAFEKWCDVGEKITLEYKITDAALDKRVVFDGLPKRVDDIGGKLAFAADMPYTIAARVARRPSVSYYAQEGLIGHLDAIENGGSGVHNSSPSTWTDLTGNHTFTCRNGSAFGDSAWQGNGSRCVYTASAKSLAALKAKAFTLEMVIAHPQNHASYEFWSFFGTSNPRELSLEIRTNSNNPLVSGMQYRANTWNEGAAIKNSNGGTTTWNKRHYLVATCVGDKAILYYDGTNVLHTASYHNTEPTSTAVNIGGNATYGECMQNGAEICAVRMTERVLTGDEIMRNMFVDAARFGAALPDPSCGYSLRESDGKLLVRVSAPAVQHAQYSLNGGEWVDELDGWTPADETATVQVRSTDIHYKPEWKVWTDTVSTPKSLTVTMQDRGPIGTVVSLH